MSEQITVKSIVFTPTKTSNKDRWILNNEITVWSGTMAQELNALIGKTINADIGQNGKYSHLIDFSVGNAPPKDITSQFPSEKVTLPHSEGTISDRERLIVRQSCLKSAVELYSQIPKAGYADLLIKGTSAEIQKIGQSVIQEIAEEFENWVCR